MAGAQTTLDLSPLPPSEQREVLDFFQFLLARRGKPAPQKGESNRRRFTDLCGKLSWKGDAVDCQRKLRDEW